MRSLVGRVVQFAFLLLSVLTVSFGLSVGYYPGQPIDCPLAIKSCSTPLKFVGDVTLAGVSLFVLGSGMLLLVSGLLAAHIRGSDDLFHQDSSGASLEH